MKQSGFTLLELIAVLVVIGILGTIAATQVGSLTSDAEIAGDLARLKAHYRYAQARSMEDVNFVYGIWGQADTYIVCRFIQHPADNSQPGSTDRITLPGENSEIVKLESGLSLSGSHLITFSHLGQPHQGGNPVGRTLQFGDGKSITITQETGFIP